MVGPRCHSPEDEDAPERPDAEASHADELRKEGATMALYVAICLLAALAAIEDPEHASNVRVLGLVWGTTLGLALAPASGAGRPITGRRHRMRRNRYANGDRV